MVCLLAVPAMAQEEIVWQHGAVMPWDAERLTNNNTLIANTGNHTVIEVNTTTNEIVWQYGTDGTPGLDPGQLDSPVDAERLLSGNTLITDRLNHRVIEVNTAGAIVWQYGTTGTSGSGYDQLNNPMDAERLTNNNTLIADRFNNRAIR
jgi:outer membrane protein assembly factor BamB